ncbi:MAG: Ig-like domain-containing protein [Lachnospiraceae bacterium]|nr:Ig-like domain-containing protein [Lachnospiraceae bacterium]
MRKKIILFALMMAMGLTCSVPAQEIDEFPEDFEGIVDEGFAGIDEGTEPEGYDEFCSGDIIEVDITGTYYTLPAQTILDQINRIRKEAYDEGLVEKYVPIKWSAVLESSSRKRAMEAGITVAHENLYGGSIWEYWDEGGFWGGGENLAWNNTHNAAGITEGINQFYSEKKDYLLELQGKSHGQTGHYTSMINPSFEYVGVAGCQMSCTPNGWFTVAMQLGGTSYLGPVDETKDTTTGKVTNRLKASSDHISKISVSGPSLLDVGLTAECSMSGTISYKNCYGTSNEAFTLAGSGDGGVSWSSSDDSVVSVDNNGIVTAISAGSATITATAGKLSRSIDIIVVSGDIKPDSVVLDKNSVELNEKEIYQLQAKIIPEGIEGIVVFSSDDTEIASVDQSGLITANKAGIAHITASCEEAKPGVCTVKVTASDVEPEDSPYGGGSTDGLWVSTSGFKPSAEYTGKPVIQDGIRVFYGNKLLTEGTDFSLSYKYNVDAASADDKNAPRVTITLKGQFTGSRDYPFTITAVDIGETAKVTVQGEQTIVGNGKPQKPVPQLYFAGKKLADKKDFTCDYNDADYSSAGVHTINVKGIGNFTGERTYRFRISDAAHDLGKASVTIASSDPADKKIYFRGEIKPSDLKVTVKIKGNVVPENLYSITSVPSKPGKGSVTIEPTDEGRAQDYCGYKIVNITSYADRDMKKVTIENFTSEKIFDLTEARTVVGITQDPVLKYNGDIMAEGKDYTVTYSSNKKAGNAKVTYTGLGRYGGKITKSFKIKPYSGTLLAEFDSSMTFTKGGVVPVVSVSDPKKAVLDPKTDYSVSIIARSNTKPGTMKFCIIGKGNFKGYRSEEYSVTIENGNLKNGTMILKDMKAVSKGEGWKSPVKITDSNGKALSAGKDYNKRIVYYYNGISSESVPAAGTIIYVTVYGINDYSGSSVTGSYMIK